MGRNKVAGLSFPLRPPVCISFIHSKMRKQLVLLSLTFLTGSKPFRAGPSFSYSQAPPLPVPMQLFSTPTCWSISTLSYLVCSTYCITPGLCMCSFLSVKPTHAGHPAELPWAPRDASQVDRAVKTFKSSWGCDTET